VRYWPENLIFYINNMLWQDIVIAIACIIFSVSLIPQIYQGFKEKKGHIAYATSVPTFIGLFAITYTYFTLGLVFSGVISFITGALWLTLFIQKLIYNKQPK